MDKYTSKTKDWLDSRYKTTNENGVYISHQPIYGFRDINSESSHGMRYCITYHAVQILNKICFNSFLDVGGGEGYKSNLVQHFFKVKVINSDISEEACKRAKEIFNIESRVADIHRLPFIDNQIDVVYCSETLEHVFDKDHALRELVRVASKAAIITVPHESKKITKRNLDQEKPHGHINSFDLGSLNFLASDGFKVLSFRILSPITIFLLYCSDAIPRDSKNFSFPLNHVVKVYNFFVPIFKIFFNKKMVSKIIKMDSLFCRIFHSYNGIIFLILKDPDVLCPSDQKNISLDEIIDFIVPYHILT